MYGGRTQTRLFLFFTGRYQELMQLLTAPNFRKNLVSTTWRQSGGAAWFFAVDGFIYRGFKRLPAGHPAGGLRSKLPSGKRSAAGPGMRVLGGAVAPLLPMR